MPTPLIVAPHSDIIPSGISFLMSAVIDFLISNLLTSTLFVLYDFILLYCLPFF